MNFSGLNADEARSFAERWLPAWTGNRPELLVSFYSDDAVYSDPAIREGVRGRAALLTYFRRLLSLNPAWVWRHEGSIPLLDGFLNHWRATIPVSDQVIETSGVCTVQIRDGRIYANHVFFDRSALLAAIGSARAAADSTRAGGS